MDAALAPVKPLAVDAMGGDHGLSVTLPATAASLLNDVALQVKMVGDETALTEWKTQLPAALSQRVGIVHATEVVSMDDTAATALRGKRDSSMRRALELVAAGDAGGMVSAGNTAALMALSRYRLKTLPGIDRPALISPLPAAGGRSYVLDLGANVGVDAEQLRQFGLMGSALVEVVEGIEAPRVGLLNVGAEQSKGSDTIQRAASLLQDSPLNYIGFVEGDDVFLGEVDVVVCDGFAGNVMLKAVEGFARFMFRQLRTTKGFRARLKVGLAKPALTELATTFDPRHYNGASLLGLTGVVVKSHGGADQLGFCNAIAAAAAETRAQLPGRIGQVLAP